MSRRGLLLSDAQDDDEASVSSNLTGSLGPPPLPSGSAIVKQGWLQKSDPRGGRWKQRWCVLLTNAFYYYVDSEMKDSKLKGAFELKLAKFVAGWGASKKSPTAFVFQMQLPKRQYFFCAATQAELLEWKEAIEGALSGAPPGSLQSPHHNGGVLYEQADDDGGSGSARMFGGSELGDSGLALSARSGNAPLYSPSAYGAGVAPRLASPAPAPGVQPTDNITFYVLVADPSRGGDRHYTMVVRADRVATMTFGKVRLNLAKTVGVPADRIVLTVEGDATPIEDSWSGEGLIHNMVKLRMTILPPATGDTVAGSLQHAAASTASPSASVPPHARGGSGGNGTAAATSQVSSPGTGKLLLLSQQSSTRSGFGGANSPSAGSAAGGGTAAAAIAALDRRARLRQIFDSVTSVGQGRGPAPLSAAVSRADLAQALSADPVVNSMPEHEALLWRLLGGGAESETPGSTAAKDSSGGGPFVTWDAFSSLLDLATADSESGRQFRPSPQSPPKRPPPASPSPAAAAIPASRFANGSSAAPLLPTPAAPPSAASTGGSTAASAPATDVSGSTGPRHVMIIKVDVPGGAGDSEAFIRIRAGDDPRQLAADFIREHSLSAADYMEPLVEEVRKMLVDAYALELADERAAHAATRVALTESRNKIDAGAATTAAALSELSEVAGLRRRILELEGQLRESTVLAASAAAERRAKEEAFRASLDLRREIVARTEAEASLREELASAQAATAAAEAQAEAMSATLAALEQAKRSQAWDRYVDGAAAGPDAAPLPGAAGDWRAWAAEKRELLERSNADRAALVEENKRLRSSLDARGLETEARLRSADDELARLRSELHAVAAARNQAEAELRSVYQQWEADGRRWAGERRKQNEQVEALAASSHSR